MVGVQFYRIQLICYAIQGGLNINSQKLRNQLDFYPMQVTENNNKRLFYLLLLFSCVSLSGTNAYDIKSKEMNIVIQSVNFRAGFALETFVKEKVNKLIKQNGNIENVNVILRREEKGKTENRSCEIRLALPGNDPVVKKSSVNYEKAILKAVDVLQKILRRRKSRKLMKRNLGSKLS